MYVSEMLYDDCFFVAVNTMTFLSHNEAVSQVNIANNFATHAFIASILLGRMTGIRPVKKVCTTSFRGNADKPSTGWWLRVGLGL